MTDVDVLIAGAGPIGLTAALELTRHGVHCRIPAGSVCGVSIRPDGYLCLVARDSPTQADPKAALKLAFR